MSKKNKNTSEQQSAPTLEAQIQGMFQQALAYHQQGQLVQAQALYESILKVQPTHFDSLQLFGYLAYQMNRHQMAVELLSKAIEINPKFAIPYSNLGLALHALKRLDESLASYDKAIALEPNFAEAYNNRGRVLRELKRFEEALACYDKALVLAPNFVEAHNNRGVVLVNLKRLEDAVVCYAQTIALKPDYADAYNNLGSALGELKRFAEAATAFEKAIAINPRNANAYNNLGYVLMTQGRNKECVAYYCKALELQPAYNEVIKRLSAVYYTLGEIDKAADMYRRWVALEPDNPIARHHLAACSHEAVPARAEDTYIESTFDDFADNFDTKLEELGYQVPRLLAEALQRECGAAHKQFSVLDAGCGTGLCGPFLAEYATRLVGVDLSAGMLAKAEARKIYDELLKAELTEYLRSQNDVFDIVLSGDTLIYFGELDSVFTAARAAMRLNGYLLFSLERIANDAADESGSGYRINPHGRYSHTEAYVQSTLSKAGFANISLQPEIMRYEGGKPVQGFVVSCRAV